MDLFDTLNVFKDYTLTGPLQDKKSVKRRLKKRRKRNLKNRGPTFRKWNDLPYDLGIKIVEKMDIVSRTRFAATSKDSRCLAVAVPVVVKRIMISRLSLSKMAIDNITIVFTDGDELAFKNVQKDDGCSEVTFCLNGATKKYSMNTNNTYRSIIDFVIPFAKISSKKVETLCISAMIPNSRPSDGERMYGLAELLELPAMSDLKEVLLDGCLDEVNELVLSNCRPNEVYLEWKYTSGPLRHNQLLRLLNKFPHLCNVEHISSSGWTFEELKLLKSTRITINTVGDKTEVYFLIIYFVHRWLRGDVRQDFFALTLPNLEDIRYEVLARLTREYSKIYLINNKRGIPALQIRAIEVKRVVDGVSQIGYIVHSQQFFGFICPRVQPLGNAHAISIIENTVNEVLSLEKKSNLKLGNIV